MFFSHYIKKCFGPRNVSDEINGFITTVELFSLTKPDLEDLFLPRSENKVTFEELIFFILDESDWPHFGTAN